MKKHWIIPWSNENGSPLVQLFGKRADPETSVTLEEKAEEIEKRINGDGTKKFDSPEQRGGWKRIYIHACYLRDAASSWAVGTISAGPKSILVISTRYCLSNPRILCYSR